MVQVLVSDSGGLSIRNFDSRDDGGPLYSEKPSIQGNNVRKQTGMAVNKPVKSKTDNYSRESPPLIIAYFTTDNSTVFSCHRSPEDKVLTVPRPGC